MPEESEEPFRWFGSKCKACNSIALLGVAKGQLSGLAPARCAALGPNYFPCSGIMEEFSHSGLSDLLFKLALEVLK